MRAELDLINALLAVSLRRVPTRCSIHPPSFDDDISDASLAPSRLINWPPEAYNQVNTSRIKRVIIFHGQDPQQQLNGIQYIRYTCDVENSRVD